MIATDPVDIAVGVSRDASIHITFSEELAPLPVSPIVVFGDALVRGTLTTGARSMTFVPDAPLPSNLVMEVVLSAMIRDRAGNPLGRSPLSDYTFSFTTVP